MAKWININDKPPENGQLAYYWMPLPEVPGEEWEDVINGETIHKN